MNAPAFGFPTVVSLASIVSVGKNVTPTPFTTPVEPETLVNVYDRPVATPFLYIANVTVSGLLITPEYVIERAKATT